MPTSCRRLARPLPAVQAQQVAWTMLRRQQEATTGVRRVSRGLHFGSVYGGQDAGTLQQRPGAHESALRPAH